MEGSGSELHKLLQCRPNRGKYEAILDIYCQIKLSIGNLDSQSSKRYRVDWSPGFWIGVNEGSGWGPMEQVPWRAPWKTMVVAPVTFLVSSTADGFTSEFEVEGLLNPSLYWKSLKVISYVIFTTYKILLNGYLIHVSLINIKVIPMSWFFLSSPRTSQCQIHPESLNFSRRIMLSMFTYYILKSYYIQRLFYSIITKLSMP